MKYLTLTLSIILLLVGLIIGSNTYQKISAFKSERAIAMNEVLQILNSNKITNSQEKKLQQIYKNNSKHIKYITVYAINSQNQKWIEDNELTETPKTIYPMDYKNATLIIGSESNSIDKKNVQASKYDLATFGGTNKKWYVQFEYKLSYYNTIELNNLFTLNYMEVFYLPFILLFLSIILIFLSSGRRKIEV